MPGNLAFQPYPHDAVIELAKRAKALGVMFKINGCPFGADYDKALWQKFEDGFLLDVPPSDKIGN